MKGLVSAVENETSTFRSTILTRRAKWNETIISVTNYFTRNIVTKI